MSAVYAFPAFDEPREPIVAFPYWGRRAMAHAVPVVIRGYKVERNAARVEGVFAQTWFVWLVALGMVVAAVPTSGITLVLLPIAIGFFRNRPMLGIILWDVFLSIILIGWIVALAKACGNR